MWGVVSAHHLAWNWWLGVASCLLVTGLAFKMRLVGAGHPPVRVYLKLPFYIVWLVWRIIAANVDVARRILSPRLPIAPRFIELKMKRPYELTKVLYANSVTLTPGTVTTAINGDTLRIHALSGQSARDLEDGTFEKKISWVEK